LFSKQAEDFDLHVVEAFDEIVNLILYRHSHTVNAFQQWENPSQGRGRCGLVDLVRYRLVVACSLLAQSALRHRVDQQGEGHHHQQPFKPAGLFDKQR
jgi:hypothetical protein